MLQAFLAAFLYRRMIGSRIPHKRKGVFNFMTLAAGLWPKDGSRRDMDLARRHRSRGVVGRDLPHFGLRTPRGDIHARCLLEPRRDGEVLAKNLGLSVDPYMR